MKKTVITLSQAFDGMVRSKIAEGVSVHTVRNYRTAFKKFQTYIASHPERSAAESKDPPFASITRGLLIEFFAWLREEYVSEPDGVAPRGRIKLSPKSVLNIHTELSALWTWAVQEGYVKENPLRTIALPDAQPPVVEPYTREQIEALVKACDRSHTWKTRELTTNTRSTADRDHAIILTLLDTGLRASELCGIKFGDVNMTANSIKVLGKGQKERVVFFGKRAAKALWKYLTPRLKDNRPDDPVFVVGPDDDPRPLTRDVLARLLARIGERAGVKGVHPHRFRHTFAITYLRNEGDLFTLQALLGHSDIEMVKRYARIAQTDCARAHQKASPVDNWRL